LLILLYVWLIQVVENFPFRIVNKPSCKIVGCRTFSKTGDGESEEKWGCSVGNEVAVPLKFVFHPSN